MLFTCKTTSFSLAASHHRPNERSVSETSSPCIFTATRKRLTDFQTCDFSAKTLDQTSY